jgi:hypothetical protein
MKEGTRTGEKMMKTKRDMRRKRRMNKTSRRTFSFSSIFISNLIGYKWKLRIRRRGFVVSVKRLNSRGIFVS